MRGLSDEEAEILREECDESYAQIAEHELHIYRGLCAHGLLGGPLWTATDRGRLALRLHAATRSVLA